MMAGREAAPLATAGPFAYLDDMQLTFDAETPPTRKLLPLQIAAPDITDWLLARDPRAIGSYRDLGREEYARAFTAAQTAGADVIDDIYAAIVANVAQGGSAKDFAGLVIPTLKAKGWLGGDQGEIASRVALIYDTNLRLARSAGRWENYQAQKHLAPYLRAFTVRDNRVRRPPHSHSDHRAWDGIILPVDHPFWSVYWTPLGFRCRCSIAQMTRSDLARSRDGITSEDELQDRIRRLGPPVFLAPAGPIEIQLDAMVRPSNDKPQRMPGRPPVDPVKTATEGGDAFDAILRASSIKDIGRQLDRIGLGVRPEPVAPAPVAPPAPRRTPRPAGEKASTRARRDALQPPAAAPRQRKTPAPAAPPKVDIAARDAIERDYVLDNGRRDGVEHLVAYDEATGQTVERKKGTRSSVVFSDSLVRALADPSRSFTLHHNHPSSSSFSEADIRVLSNAPAARAIWAHGHNGSSFYAEAGAKKFNPKTLKAVSGALQRELQAAVNRLEISIPDASLLLNHLAWLQMQRLGQITYRAELAGESAQAAERNADLLARIVTELFS